MLWQRLAGGQHEASTCQASSCGRQGLALLKAGLVSPGATQHRESAELRYPQEAISMQPPRTLRMMMTPDHQGGIKREEEPSLATKQVCLHTVVRIPVKNGSQARAPRETSHLRTETHAQDSPVQLLLKFPYPRIC